MENEVNSLQWAIYRKLLARSPPPHFKSDNSPLPIIAFFLPSLHSKTKVGIPLRQSFQWNSTPSARGVRNIPRKYARIIFIKLFKPSLFLTEEHFGVVIWVYCDFSTYIFNYIIMFYLLLRHWKKIYLFDTE